jgi:hypothetical protein
MAGLVPAIRVYPSKQASNTWMPGTSPGMTMRRRSLLAMTESYVAFFANVALRLSNSSTFTPLRRMMKLCWSTESVLFQAQ